MIEMKLRERIEGTQDYYKRLLKTGHGFSELIHEEQFGKITRKKVLPFLAEAHTIGVFLGLQEALQLLDTQETMDNMEVHSKD